MPKNLEKKYLSIHIFSFHFGNIKSHWHILKLLKYICITRFVQFMQHTFMVCPEMGFKKGDQLPLYLWAIWVKFSQNI